MGFMNKSIALKRGSAFKLYKPYKSDMSNYELDVSDDLRQLMELSFMILELNMYLDTHLNDKDALDALKYYISIYKEEYMKYVKANQLLQVTDYKGKTKYDWQESNWPWEVK